MREENSFSNLTTENLFEIYYLSDEEFAGESIFRAEEELKIRGFLTEKEGVYINESLLGNLWRV